MPHVSVSQGLRFRNCGGPHPTSSSSSVGRGSARQIRRAHRARPAVFWCLSMPARPDIGRAWRRAVLDTDDADAASGRASNRSAQPVHHGGEPGTQPSTGKPTFAAVHRPSRPNWSACPGRSSTSPRPLASCRGRPRTQPAQTRTKIPFPVAVACQTFPWCREPLLRPAANASEASFVHAHDLAPCARIS